MGGGALNDDDNLINRLAPLKHTKKSMVMGNSISNIASTDNIKNMKLIENADNITVRDNYSKEYLESFINREIKVTADPAFLLKCKNKKIKEGTIGISLKNLTKINSQTRKKLLLFLKHNIKKLSKEYELHFISFAPEDTIIYNKHFKQYSNNFHYARSPLETIKTIGTMEKMVCMRLHSVIFSIINEKPMFIINYSDKMNELSEKLNNYVKVNEVDEKEIIEFNENKDHIKKVKDEYYSRSLENLKIFEKLIIS